MKDKIFNITDDDKKLTGIDTVDFVVDNLKEKMSGLKRESGKLTSDEVNSAVRVASEIRNVLKLKFDILKTIKFYESK